MQNLIFLVIIRYLKNLFMLLKKKKFKKHIAQVDNSIMLSNQCVEG